MTDEQEKTSDFIHFADSDGPWGVKCAACYHTALATHDPRDIEHRSTCINGKGKPGRYVVGIEGHFDERY